MEPTAPVSKSLKKGDILLSFDGVGIANDGTVPFRSGERISFNYLVSKKYTNEEVRNHERKEKTVPFGVNLMRSEVLNWAAQGSEEVRLHVGVLC